VLTISESRLIAQEPSGVAALVNCLGMYDYHNMSLIKLVLSLVGGVFVDVGANIGSYTLVASEVDAAQVVSIEPHPRTYALLGANLELNHRDNVLTQQYAISDSLGTARFTDGEESSVNRVAGPNEAIASLMVECITLDALCELLGVRPTVVKIDVEGHEPRVLDGFQSYGQFVQLLQIERGQGAEISALVRAWGLAGPWYFHAPSKCFRSQPQRRPEDPVYLHPGLCTMLRGLGYAFQPAGGAS